MTRLVVLGDSLLDVDLYGRVERVCPDAPVPVVDEVAEHPRPGGAALAALLAARDGHQVTLVTPVGHDEAAERLRDLLAAEVRLVALDYDGPTSVKRRVRVDGHSLVRLDTGSGSGRIGVPGADVLDAVGDADAVLVSDYGRGATGVPSLRDRLADLRAPVVWDPHPRGAAPVRGVRLVTPNASEAGAFASEFGSSPDNGSVGLAAVARCAAALVRAWQVGAVAVTMGEAGALLSYGDGAPVVVPAPDVAGRDSCGAGDRFAATAAASLGAGALPEESVRAAVYSASAFVAAGGAAAVPEHRTPPGRGDGAAASGVDHLLAQVRARRGTVVATGGCFDLLHTGHIASLRAARSIGDCLVVCLNSDASVRRLKGDGRPLVRAADRARVLEALECVDAVVVFDEDTPDEVLRKVRPDVWAKGGDYAGTDLPEAAVLAEWGGQAVVLPYVRGRSTTALVNRLTDPTRQVGARL